MNLGTLQTLYRHLKALDIIDRQVYDSDFITELFVKTKGGDAGILHYAYRSSGNEIQRNQKKVKWN